MRTQFSKITSLIAVSLIPLSAFAAGMDTVNRYIGNITKLIIQPLILLLFTAAMFYLVIGAMNLILKADDPKARETGRRMLIWGVVGFFVMVASIAILQAVTYTFCGTAFCIGAS